MRDHISICICTYKRPGLLKKLLEALLDQNTNNNFMFSIVVIDNDQDCSAKAVIKEIQGLTKVDIIYQVESIQNIARARNLAVLSSIGNYIAFIDDDEIPIKNWISYLYETCKNYNVDGVLGPVVPVFEKKTKEWMVKGKIYERPRYKTGTLVHWGKSRTGNLLFKKSILNNNLRPFKEEYKSQGEDIIFFKEKHESGFKFAWCDEAIVSETVFENRLSVKYLLNRALLQGYTSLNYISGNKFYVLCKSLLALIIYSCLLPILAVMGMQYFMKYLIKHFNHLSRVSALLGIKLVKDRNSLEG
jgi:glycosyltransferase involved in cell wall biosynthesis